MKKCRCGAKWKVLYSNRKDRKPKNIFFKGHTNKCPYFPKEEVINYNG